ncbi:hypothetical protein JN085_14505 [Mycolicibacterium austroafricanum]|nr:hypothetical protein JN085_14505 [Mycolicibacterium austroafricanum]
MVLVTCVKTKRDHPSPAKDLYTSQLFRKQRAYAEHSGVPWFILSAEHGLVAPDEWLAPYERYPPDMSKRFRSAWSAWVAARLELLAGPLAGKKVEIHAGSVYLDAVRPELEALGATVADPLKGLSMGQGLSWYGGVESDSEAVELDPAPIATILRNSASALSPAAFLAAGKAAADRPGLYSWWVDEVGAAELTRGLGAPIESGLVYAGLAGATRWPSAKRSQNTLWLRITTMHLGGNHEFSTFRRTLGAILASADGSTRVDEERVTRWIDDHMRVVTTPYDDRDTLGRIEKGVLEALDPPLNLQGMQLTPLRRRLRELRALVMTPDGTE